MTTTNFWTIEVIPWYCFALYWGLNAFHVKSTKKLEPVAARLYTIALIALVFSLLFSNRFESGVLGRSFLVVSSATETAGIVLTYAGVALAIWARWNIGQNWSARVSLKVDHELVRSGPYARLRHPIYSGLLLAVIGRALFIGEWRGVLAVLIIAVVHSLKAKREEALMLQTFGEQYRAYQQQAGFLLPKL